MSRGAIGQNLSYLKSYSGRVLIDAMKQAEVPVQVGADLRIEVITKGTPEAFNGAYDLEADEPFTVKITGGSPASIAAVSPTSVGINILAKPGQTAQLFLLFPGRTTLPKGIRLIRPGYTVAQADAQVFTTEYIDLLKKLNVGCIRLMDIMRTNGSECTDSWCDPSATLWGVKGVGAPLEPLVDLANTLGADVWYCFPAKGTDAHARKAAELLKANLSPGQRVYLEYTNEAWNDKFPQYQWLRQQTPGGGNSRHTYAKRASEVAAIFADVFKAERWRLVTMLAGCTADSGVLREGLAFGWKPDALATGGYFNAPADAMPIEDWWAAFADNARKVYAGTQIQKFNALAATGPFEKLIYEWTGAVDNEVTADSARNDPHNAAVYAAAGEGIFGNGFTQACHFVPAADKGSKYAATNEVGTWTAKCQALADLSAAHPHPLAMDPRDAEIARLKAIVGFDARTILDLQLQVSGLTSERDRARNETDALKAKCAAAMEALK